MIIIIIIHAVEANSASHSDLRLKLRFIFVMMFRRRRRFVDFGRRQVILHNLKAKNVRRFIHTSNLIIGHKSPPVSVGQLVG